MLACVLQNGKTPCASPSPFKPTAAGGLTIHFRSRNKKHVKEDLRLCYDDRAEEGVFLGNDLTTQTFWLWSFKHKKAFWPCG
jgi:hypothetical protein